MARIHSDRRQIPRQRFRAGLLVEMEARFPTEIDVPFTLTT